MDTNFATLNIDRPRAHVTLVTLNRPASANAMNSQLGTKIMTLFESINLDAGDARCIVVRALETEHFVPVPISKNERT
jgi:enoyl-CoA hydratase/carnithine racemase